ncbi:cilia- and flagella-associated protein 46 isoform X2 [Anguilla anguilla]|uniref:cilia- and flagella-associated protein 46 isoform X2 n=1 Tax=Anguilla anguilla TaxID=7936 RepID=UPI0015AB06C0|nr:cilia- and flagella-associated protein 46 isoform X2 [Anguilla anguilla]
MDLQIRQFLTKAETQKDAEALKKAYDLINEGTKEKALSGGRCFCPELYVICAEQAFQLGLTEISETCLMMYFKGKPPANQFLCRAYLCQGQLCAQTLESMDDVEKAVMHFLKAIEISKEQPRYHFLVFNASVLYLQTVRPFLRPGSRQRLQASLTQVLRALEEVGEADYRWRAELMLLLIECLVEAGKLKEAASLGKVTADFIGAHTPDLYPRIFSLQVQHKLLDLSKSPKKVEETLTLSVIYKMQKLKHQVGGAGRRDDGANLKEIFLLLTNPTAARPPGAAQSSNTGLAESNPSIMPGERASFLLELGHLALQLGVPQMTSDCLGELKRAGLSDVGLLIAVECLKCELELHKRGPRLEEYKRSDVEAQQKLVWRLDQLLQNALRAGGAGTVQGVCATLWNACLPLLQHNLRRSIRKPLLRLAQVLEDSNSTLLDLRCQVHSEVGVMEAEEGCVESAVEHVQKALRLDASGERRERLTAALHALRLRALLYDTPERSEDRAALLIQQARTAGSRDSRRKVRAMLVNAGVALAPDDFRTVLDADNAPKVTPGNRGENVVSQLAAKAEHHIACVQRAEGHLQRQGGKTSPERVRLWAELAKAARKLEAWSVCRAACRFCVLHDDGCQETPSGNGAAERDLLRLLAELRFINAEATVQKLRLEGVQLNGAPVLPPQRGKRPAEGASTRPEDDPLWATYRDWVQSLSAYATSNFLRAAQLGAELGEAWIVSNAAVYLWNYNSHVLASGGQRHLVATFQTLVDLMKQTGHAGQAQLLVLLCNAVAQGLILPWIPPACGPGAEGQDSERAPPSRARKGAEKTGSLQGQPLEPEATPDVRKALELCEYALRLTNGSVSADSLSIATRKQIIGTWVRTKQLLQQQIGQKLDFEEESKTAEVSSLWRVLVGVEMLVCNSNSRLMEFSAPSAGELVRMASECVWTDPLVELQVWTHLAHFSHQAQEGELVMTCSQNALQLEAPALKKVKVATLALYSSQQVFEMLSRVACLRGLGLVQKSKGHPDLYRAGLHTLQSSVSYAEKAGSQALCMEGARHYWNSCLPLLRTPQERQQLQNSVEKILRAMASTSSRDGKEEGTKTPVKAASDSSLGAASPGLEISGAVRPDDDLTLRAAFYGLLFCIHGNRNDWRAGLRVLDQAVREMPRTRHRLPLFKQRAVARARLGEIFLMDMQRFGDEGEECLSHMWHHMAHCSTAPEHKLACFQNAITSLQGPGSRWLKVEYLLEFGAWLYWAHFPSADAMHPIRWAEDMLLHMQAGDQRDGDSGSEISKQKDEELKAPLTEEAELVPLKQESQVGVESSVSSLALSDLRDVQQLEGLLRVHTLLAAMTGGGGGGGGAPPHLQHCLLAYTCVLRIWQVSLGTAGEVITEVTDSQAPLPPQAPASAKRDKGKKPKEPLQLTAEDKPKRKGPAEVPAEVPPTGPEEWARFHCPPEVRQAFRHDRSPRTVNQHSVSKQTQTLYFLDLLVKELNSCALTHLTLPVLHLAEVIAHDLMDSKSVSDLYRLRIARACSQLRLSASVSYHEKRVGPAYIYEEERMACREAVASLREDPGRDASSGHGRARQAATDSAGLEGGKASGRCAQGIWTEKAEMLLGLGRYQPARELLAEAHLVAMKVGDRSSQAKSLLLLAELANQERHHGQALALLREAQAIGGDEDFWYHVTLCMVKATLDGGGEEKETQACRILEHASAVLRSVLEERPNRGPGLRFLVASLETRRAVLQVKSLKTSASVPEAVEMLTAACDALRHSADEFLQLGHQEHGAEALLEQAEALRILAKHADSEEVQRRHLLDSYCLMQKAISRQQEVVLTALSLLPAQPTQTLSLPAVRRLVRFRLALAGLVIDMLERVCREQKERERLRERRSSVERTVEDFLQGSPDLTSLQREWQSVSRTLGQVALTQLQTAIGLSADCVEDRAASLSMLGKCLLLLAVQRDPLYPPIQWDVPNVAPTPPDTADPETVKDGKGEESETGAEDSHGPSVTDQKQSTPTSTKLQEKRDAAMQLLAQASETLAQAVGLCLQHQLTHILPTACLTALECHGQFDPSSTGQYLALYQSSVCCAQMAEVLRAACSDSSESQLSALLNLHTNLQGAAQSGEPASSLLGPTKDTLTHLSKAYTHLNINPNHLSILGELPSTFSILLLQHSEDGSALYGALFEKAKPADSQRGKGPPPAAGTLDCSGVAKVSACPATLSSLQERARSFKREATRSLAREESQPGGNWGVARGGAMAEGHAMTSHPRNVQSEVASHFNTLVQDMEGYLHPLLSQFALPWVRGRAPSAHLTEGARPTEREERSVSDKERSPVDPGASVVLLVDSMLMDLPLEALSILQGEGLSSVSRDFCLQLLHARLQRDESAESESRKDARGGRGAKTRGDQSKAFKGVPVNRVLPPDALPVDAHNVKYVVDPYSEAGDTGGAGPVQGMRRILEVYGQQTTPLWEGILGPEHAPSLDELEHLLTNCSAFIFNGTEHFLANIPPSKIVSMKLSDCQMVMLFDQAHTSSSALRQTKLDALKSPGRLALEGPLGTAALLSLGGVRTITLNQWHSTFQRNTGDMDAMLESLLKVGVASGQAVHALRKGTAQSCTVSEEGGESGDDCRKGSAGPELPEVTRGSSHSASPFAFNHIIYGLPNLVMT